MTDNLQELIKINPIVLIIGNPLEHQRIDSILQSLDNRQQVTVMDGHLAAIAASNPELRLPAYTDLRNQYFSNLGSNQRLVLIETLEGFNVPTEIERFVKIYRFPLPDQQEIEALYLEYELETTDQTIGYGRGLTNPELEIAIKEAKTSGQDIWQYLDNFRAHKLGLLGLKYFPTPESKAVGGLDLILETIPKIKYCLSPEGRAKGLPLPKGLLLVGLPGTGKTFIAQVFAAELGFPMIALAMDAICDGGAPALTKALEAIESMAPCILFADEFDKLFSKGVDRQVLGTFLSWLQDHKTFVYTFGTLNRLRTLPSELTRTGRFDNVFGLEFPLPNSRLHLLEIYLGKYDFRYRKLLTTCTETDLRLLAENTNYFLASDIAQLACEVAIEVGMRSDTEITVSDVIRRAKTFATLYRRDPDSILEMLNEFKGKCSPAESPSTKYITGRFIDAY
jgi:ATP-dependent 26S proteasome regulatory subunit